MKKLIAMFLVAVMALGMAACDAAEESAPTTTEVTPVEALTTIWNQYAEGDKFFAMGGDFNNPVDGAPGAVDVANADFLSFNLLVPEAEQAGITAAASLVHAMNANTFTCGAYQVADASAFAAAMQTAIQSNQWMCGFPETLLITSVEDVVIVTYGHTDVLTTFKANMTNAYPTVEILINEAISG